MQKKLFGRQEPEGWLTEAQARELVYEYAEPFRGIMFGSFIDLTRHVSEEGRSLLISRTQASIVSDFAQARARETFASVDSVHCCMDLNFFKIFIDGKAVIRIKKLDNELLAMNVKTDQQRDWFNNFPIDGVPQHFTRLTLGYTTTDAGDEIEDIQVTNGTVVS